MTYDDDYIRLQFDWGYKDLTCKAAGFDWPPPEVIEVMTFRMRRRRHSSITDDERKGMTHVCRGAEYTIDSDQTNKTGRVVVRN